MRCVPLAEQSVHPTTIWGNSHYVDWGMRRIEAFTRRAKAGKFNGLALALELPMDKAKEAE
jgi:hypothetical protein